MKFITCFFLTVALAFGGLTGCKSQSKAEKERKAALKKSAKADLRDESAKNDTDVQAFIGRLRKAVAARDMNTIASMMTPNFGYKVEPKLEGDGVFKYWDDNNLWPELEGILSENFVKKGDYMVAPPQFADSALNYDGYRAGLRKVGGSWKFVYFVNG